MYTGARIGEITQLRAEDIYQEGDVSVVRLLLEAGTIKDREPRTVPIHEHPIAQGFLEFVGRIGSGPLFYDLTRHEAEDPVTSPAAIRANKLAPLAIG